MANTPQERLRELVAKGAELKAKGIRSAEDSAEMKKLLAEAQDLREQIDQDSSFGELEDFAGRSAGKLPMAGNGVAQVDEMYDAGHTTIARRDTPHGPSFEIIDEQGEGQYRGEIRKVVNSGEYAKALRSYLRTPIGGDVPSKAMRTLTEGADTAGGFFVPEDVLNMVLAKKPTPTRVQTRITQLETGRDQVTVPVLRYSADDKYTSPVRVTWTGEQPASDTAARVTDPVTGQITISVHTAMLSMLLSNNLIEDSSFNLLSYIAGHFGQVIELLKDDVTLNGTGQNQPYGITVNPSVGGTDATKVKAIKSGASGSIGTDGTAIQKVAFDLPEQYDDNSVWVFNKTSTAQAIAGLTDSNGRFLWGTGLQDSGLEAGWKDRALIGYPVMLSGFMPDIADGAYPILFGDLSGYYMVNRVGFSIQVLREKYAEQNMVAVLGRVRFGGQVAEPWKLRLMQTHS